MATIKFEFSLRLRHETDDLLLVTEQLGFASDAGWNKGEQNRTISGALRAGTRDASYRNFSLGAATSVDMDDAVSECLEKLTPFASVLQSFVSSGGMASLAVGWFFDSAVGGDRIPAEIMAEIVRLNLTLDLYLYFSPEPSATAKLAAG